MLFQNLSILFLSTLFSTAFAWPTSLPLKYRDTPASLPACDANSFRTHNEPCGCPEGTIFRNSTTTATIGASVDAVKAVTYSCKIPNVTTTNATSLFSQTSHFLPVHDAYSVADDAFRTRSL